MGAHRAGCPVVEVVAHAQLVLVAQSLGDGAHVGEPADLLLEVVVGVGDHLRVDAEAGHHDEGVLVDRVVLSPDLDEAEIDGSIVARERGLDGVVEVVRASDRGCGRAGCPFREGSRASETVLAHGLGDRPHRSVAAGRDDHVGSGIQRLFA